MLSEKQQKWRTDLMLALTEALDALKLCESDEDLRSATEVLAFIGEIIREDRRPAPPDSRAGGNIVADQMVLELARKLVQLLQDPHPGLSMWVQFRNEAAVSLYGALIEVGTSQLATKVWRPPSAMPEAPRAKPLDPPPPSRRILLVDLMGEALVASMNDLHIGCAWVKTLDEARRELDRRSFDVVVTELMIDTDEPDGLELLKELQPTGQPVVVVTACSELLLVKQALNLGARCFIEKPFRVDELVKALELVWDEPRGLGHFVERAFERAGLTPKERDIARLVLKGLSTKEIEGVTGNTDKTIKHHIAAVFHKFDVRSRGELFHCIFPT